VIASLLLGERPALLALAGIGLGIVSIVLVSYQQTADHPKHEAASPPVRLPTAVGTALVSGVLIGLFLLTLAQTHSGAGMWPLVVSRTVSVVLFAGVAIAGGRSLRMGARLSALAIAGGTIDMLANALYLLAAHEGPLSLVVTLSSLYPASTVLLARVVLGERLNPWQLTGVACALAAIVLVVSGGRV
jgi:drug/metabolite transporter (DMT)-like permease